MTQLRHTHRPRVGHSWPFFGGNFFLLWSAGKACRQSNVWAYNCSYVAPTCPQDLGEIMYISMCGAGLGFAVEWENVQQFPQIKKQVKEDCACIGMDDPSIFRMMEQENLNAFKDLIKISNTSLLKDVIKDCCDIGMCNYSTILMMYKEQDKASKKSMEW